MTPKTVSTLLEYYTKKNSEIIKSTKVVATGFIWGGGWGYNDLRKNVMIKEDTIYQIVPDS